jgi:N-acetylmuramoyl-L-alanine amidase
MPRDAEVLAISFVCSYVRRDGGPAPVAGWQRRPEQGQASDGRAILRAAGSLPGRRVNHARGRCPGRPGRPGRRVLAMAVATTLTGLLASGCTASTAASDPAATRTGSGAGHLSPSAPAASSPSPSPSPPGRDGTRRPLAGKIVGIDPGHNGLNSTDPAFLAHQVFNVRPMEDCNTVGSQTAAGYTESLFNFKVAAYLAADLRRDGARVVLTRPSNHGLGPCVNRRSTMLNHTDVAIDIHADGGPAWGRGFTVLEPIADGPNDRVIGSSVRFGRYVHRAFLADTPLPVSDYYGHDGYQFRDDLAGLNLTTVPKVLIECGNMPNRTDAALLSTARGQREIAAALEAAIIRFLTGTWPPGQRG